MTATGGPSKEPSPRRLSAQLTADFPEMAYARESGGSKYCGLRGVADQHAVGNWCRAGADAEQGVEGSVTCPAPIEAEHELIEVVLEVGFPQPVVDAQAPALEV